MASSEIEYIWFLVSTFQPRSSSSPTFTSMTRKLVPPKSRERKSPTSDVTANTSMYLQLYRSSRERQAHAVLALATLRCQSNTLMTLKSSLATGRLVQKRQWQPFIVERASVYTWSFWGRADIGGEHFDTGLLVCLQTQSSVHLKLHPLHDLFQVLLFQTELGENLLHLSRGRGRCRAAVRCQGSVKDYM